MKQVKVVLVLDVQDHEDGEITAKNLESELGDVFASDSDNRFGLDKLEGFWEVSDPIVSGRVEVDFEGKVIGFVLRGENKMMTKSRLLLEAEQRVNQIGDIRAHMNGK